MREPDRTHGGKGKIRNLCNLTHGEVRAVPCDFGDLHHDLQRPRASCVQATRLWPSARALLSEEYIELWNARSLAASRAILRFIGLPLVRRGFVATRTNDWVYHACMEILITVLTCAANLHAVPRRPATSGWSKTLAEEQQGPHISKIPNLEPQATCSDS